MYPILRQEINSKRSMHCWSDFISHRLKLRAWSTDFCHISDVFLLQMHGVHFGFRAAGVLNYDIFTWNWGFTVKCTDVKIFLNSKIWTVSLDIFMQFKLTSAIILHAQKYLDTPYIKAIEEMVAPFYLQKHSSGRTFH